MSINMTSDLKKNIRKFYVFSILSSFVLYYSIDKIFLQARGLSVTDIVLIEIVYAVLVVLLEVPSGAISDRWSRKYVLALNMVFFTVSTFLWAIAHSLQVFIIGALLFSVHTALYSGTDTSFLFDTLKESGKEKNYEKVLGKKIWYQNLFAIIAGILGSMIADAYGLVLPFWLTIIFSVAAVLTACSLKEPHIHRSTGEMKYWEHIVHSGKYIWKHPWLFHLIVLGVLLGISLNFVDEYGQLYFVSVGFPVLVLGYLAAVGNGIEAIAGRYAYKLSKLPHQYVYLALVVLSAGGLFAAAFIESMWGAAFLFLPTIAYYFATPLISGDLHKSVPSSHRATVESYMSLLKMIFLIPVAFGFSYLADSFSIFAAYLGVGILTALYLLFYFASSFRKISNRINH